MTTVWVVCGAGRGVGKTHLAQRLCEVLPEATCAKCGRGQPKSDRPANFFGTQKQLAAFIASARRSHGHIVIESNAWARSGEGDIVIYVDAIEGDMNVRRETNVRSDARALQAKSHLQVTKDASAGDWETALAGKLSDPALCEAVCGVLAEQRRYLERPHLAVRSKVWFVADDTHALGPGVARLLEGIERYGTLRQAAGAAQMSYRYAWGLIKAAEKQLHRRLVLPSPGGVGGGRSTLSAHGRHLLEVFRRVSSEVAEFADARFAAHYHKEPPDEQ